MNKKLRFIALLCMVTTIVCVLLSSNAFATDFDIDEKSSTKVTELTGSSQESTAEPTTEKTTTKPTTEKTTAKPTTEKTTAKSTTSHTTKPATQKKVLATYSSTKNISLNKGESKNLTVGFSGNLLYNVGDSKIVIVSHDGTVYGLKAGTTYVQVHNDKYVQNFQITVKDGETTTAEGESESNTETETIKVVGNVTNEPTTLEISSKLYNFDENSNRTTKLTILLFGLLAITVIALVAVLIYNKLTKIHDADPLFFDDAISADFNPDNIDDNEFYEFEDYSDDDLDNYNENNSSSDNSNDPFLE